MTEALLPLARQLEKVAPRLPNNEGSVVLQLRLMLECGDLARVIGCQPITQHAFEFILPGAGRVDLALFHDDGGVTLVEAKAPEGNRALAGGIGQLFVYEGAVRAMRFGGRLPAYVTKVLCAPTSAEESAAISCACDLAGVLFLRLAPTAQFKFLLMDAMGMSYA